MKANTVSFPITANSLVPYMTDSVLRASLSSLYNDKLLPAVSVCALTFTVS